MFSDNDQIKLLFDYYETISNNTTLLDLLTSTRLNIPDNILFNIFLLNSHITMSNKRSYEECSSSNSQSKYIKSEKHLNAPKIQSLQGFKNNFDAIESFLRFIRNKEQDSFQKTLSECKKDYTKELEKDIIDHYNLFKQATTLYKNKVSLKDYVQLIISKYYKGSSLYIVGSSNSGFGINDSDLDMCLCLPHIQEEDHKRICTVLYRIRHFLNHHRLAADSIVVPAKVPILKFVDLDRGIDVDININNIIGIKNTYLLKAYSKIDQRVSPLVIFLKHWAKYHDINDASRQTLSSYTLVLMILHFLQAGCSPPVVPALQSFKTLKDIFRPDNPSHFLNREPCLDNLEWKSKNTLNLGELLLNFFRYYGIEFNYEKDAASIRSGTRIPRCQVTTNHVNVKHNLSWKFLCVEEPFNRTNTAYSVYNLTAFARIKATLLWSYKWLSADTRISSIFKSLPPHALFP